MNSALMLDIVPLLVVYAVIMVLFLKNRRELKRLRTEAMESARLNAAGVTSLSMQLEGIRNSVRQMEEFPVAAVPTHGINLNRRAQVVRMYRRGENIPSIAAAMRAPTREVELVLKLHHMLNA